ncbi:MAG TPA: ROK family protein, partial [Bacteroidales bacterium]|nr:ROK family protein [Bacteroidales bacterium]
MKKVVAGVDIGGTNTVFGIVDTEGKVLADGHFKTTDYPDVKDFVKALGANVKKLLAGKKDLELVGIGIGAPDANYHRGTIEHAPNLLWKGIVPLGDLVKKELN